MRAVSLLAVLITLLGAQAAGVLGALVENGNMMSTSCASTAADMQTEAVASLACRVLGAATCARIAFNVDVSSTVRQTPIERARADLYGSYFCGADGVSVEVHGASGVGAAMALYDLLTRFWNSSLTWGVNGTGLHIPPTWPPPLGACPANTTIHVNSTLGLRYFGNQCTFGYTTAFWGWQQWEERIDWMALHGINVPLASEGTELAEMNLYTQHYNLSRSDMLAYFTSPAYFPWLRMGNMHTFLNTNLTYAQLLQRSILQQRMLARMRSLGMRPVLPAFNGNVPNAFAKWAAARGHKVLPGANWNEMGPEYSEDPLLDPTDSLFTVIASQFRAEVDALYGPAEFYAADTWNENMPPWSNATMLAASAEAVYGAIGADGAVWVMQGWTFAVDTTFWTAERVAAYLSGAPVGGLLVLDLMSDYDPWYTHTAGYFGHSFVWNMLHNFGGRRGIYGNVTRLVEAPRAAAAAYPAGMVGVGLTMEATNQNVPAYEAFLATSLDTSSTPEDTRSVLDDWVERFIGSRYPTVPGGPAAMGQWLKTLLFGSAPSPPPYAVNPPSQCCSHFSALDHTPWFMEHNLSTGDLAATFTGYDADAIVTAARQLATAANETARACHGANDNCTLGPLHFDAVDVSRQLLANLFTDLNAAVASVLRNTSAAPLDLLSQIQDGQESLLAVLHHLDRLLGTDANFLLGNWLNEAEASAQAGGSPRDANDFAARYQVSSYGAFTIGTDYASKEWQGAVSQLYLPRWTLFANMTREALIKRSADGASSSVFPPLSMLSFFPSMVAEVDSNFVALEDSGVMRTASVPPSNFSAVVDAVASSIGTYPLKPLGNSSTQRTFSGVMPRCAVDLLPPSSSGCVVHRAWHKDARALLWLCKALGPAACAGFVAPQGLLLAPGADITGDTVPAPGSTFVLLQP